MKVYSVIATTLTLLFAKTEAEKKIHAGNNQLHQELTHQNAFNLAPLIITAGALLITAFVLAKKCFLSRVNQDEQTLIKELFELNLHDEQAVGQYKKRFSAFLVAIEQKNKTADPVRLQQLFDILALAYALAQADIKFFDQAPNPQVVIAPQELANTIELLIKKLEKTEQIKPHLDKALIEVYREITSTAKLKLYSIQLSLLQMKKELGKVSLADSLAKAKTLHSLINEETKEAKKGSVTLQQLSQKITKYAHTLANSQT